MIRRLLLGTAFAGIATLASAESLAPIHHASIDLGSTRGSAYYVVGKDGYHVVATLQSGRANTPIRFNAILATGQSASISIPGPAGTTASEVTFSRIADRLDIRQTAEIEGVFTH